MLGYTIQLIEGTIRVREDTCRHCLRERRPNNIALLLAKSPNFALQVLLSGPSDYLKIQYQRVFHV